MCIFYSRSSTISYMILKITLLAATITFTDISHTMGLDSQGSTQNTRDVRVDGDEEEDLLTTFSKSFVPREYITMELERALYANDREAVTTLCQQPNAHIDYEYLTFELLRYPAGPHFESLLLPILAEAHSISGNYVKPCENGKTLMELCIEQGRVNVFEILLAKKNYDSHLLDLAMKKKHLPMVNALLNAKEFAVGGPGAFTYLLVLAFDNQVPLEILQSIVKKGKQLGWEVDRPDFFSGYWPLTNALLAGNTPAVQLLIDEGCKKIGGIKVQQDLYKRFHEAKKEPGRPGLHSLREGLRTLLSQKNKLADLDNNVALRLAVIIELSDHIKQLIFDGGEYDHSWVKEEDDDASIDAMMALRDGEIERAAELLALLTKNFPVPPPLLSIIQAYAWPTIVGQEVSQAT